MYLTAGQFKGRKIEIPKSAKPTLSKVRQSVFNILIQYELPDNSFLDMFAGSAIMGLEALSRGYSVKEIEINSKSAQIIKKNYEQLKVKANITICDALKFKGETFSVVYIDPPWDMDYSAIVKKASKLVKTNGIIVIEYDELKKIDIQQLLEDEKINLQILKEKKYGRAKISILTTV